MSRARRAPLGAERRLLGRRAALGVMSAAALLFAHEESEARRRSSYGGTLRLDLPIADRRFDPQDPEDLSAALLGAGLFEPLFALAPGGAPYATLADGLPEARRGRLWVRLRPDLEGARGEKLDAASLLASWERAARAGLFPPASGKPKREGQLEVSFPSSAAPEELARLLAQPSAALLPADFSPDNPSGAGALRARRSGGRLVLERNPRAARGGSFLDAVELKTVDLPENLRSFEAGTTDLGWLGAGLHRPRRDAVPFRSEAIGYVVLLAGKNLGSWGAPGVLQAATAAVPDRNLSSLGVSRPAVGPAARFAPRKLRLTCADDSPQLARLAELVAEAWSSGPASVEVEARPRAELRERRKTGDYDVLLTFLAARELSARELHLSLLGLDGAPLPTRVLPEAPERLARRLRLGVLGALTPHGAVNPAFSGLLTPRGFDLANAELVQTKK